MADKKISELTDYTTPKEVDIFPIVDIAGMTPKKITWAKLKAQIKDMRGVTVTRVNGLVSQIAYSDGETINVTRTGNFISSFTDGINIWTITRNANKQITSWSVT